MEQPQVFSLLSRGQLVASRDWHSSERSTVAARTRQEYTEHFCSILSHCRKETESYPISKSRRAQGSLMMKQKLAEHMLLCGRQGGHLRHIQEVFMRAVVKDTSEAESCWCWAAKAQCSCFSTGEPQINVWCEFQGRGDEEINDPDRRRDSARWSPMTTFPGNLFTLLGELLGERWNRLEMTTYILPKSKTVRFTVARALVAVLPPRRNINNCFS